MSKAFVRVEAQGPVRRFDGLLPKVEPQTIEEAARARLGRTAEGLQKLKDEAQLQGKEEGRAVGLEEGRIEGYEAARQEMAEEVQRFSQALDEAAARVEAGMADWYVAAEPGLAALSVAIAGRILAQELRLKGDAITSLVREAIREIAAADSVRIRVSPFDLDALAKNRQLVLAASPTVRSIEIVADEAIEGGAKIESSAGAIDATIRAQLDLAYEALRRK